MDWLQSAFLVFVIASALVGIGLLVRHAFNFYAEGVRQIIDTRYELKRSECLRNGGDATSLQHDLYGPYIVTCWRNDRPLYTTKFPHPLDG